MSLQATVDAYVAMDTDIKKSERDLMQLRKERKRIESRLMQAMKDAGTEEVSSQGVLLQIGHRLINKKNE
jgi:hypothetical protein